MSTCRSTATIEASSDMPLALRERWTLPADAAAYARDRAEALGIDAATFLADLVRIERRRVEGG